MAKFKVGDKVVGNKLADGRYTITKTGWTGTVTEVAPFSTDWYKDWYKDCDIAVDGFHVESKYFDLIERDGVPCSSMTVGGITFTAAMPIVSGPEYGPDDEVSIVPKRILKSGDRTIVFWQDGTKTIVKRAEDEADNDYAAFTAALAIKLFGSNSALKRMIDKKLEYQKPKTEKKESPLHAEPVVDAMGSLTAMAIDNLVKKTTELAESIGRRIVIDVGPVVEEDDKK